jgi:hypothetical protein
MYEKRLTGIRGCLAVTGAIGLFTIGQGITNPVLLPAASLDVVLTPEELRDPKIREETQAMLKRLWAVDGSATVWVIQGTAITAASAVGLWFARGKLNS